MTRLREFDDAEAMAQAAAKAVALRLDGAIHARGAASLSLAGGTTPARTYELLSDADLAWERVTVTLSDERWVAPDRAESNEGLVRRTLLHGRASPARFIGLFTEGEAADAPSLIEERLAAAPPPIDVGILGLGEDGHTASLFPCDDTAMAAAGRVAAVAHDGPGASRARMTMTLSELAAHRFLIVLAAGMNKRAIIDTVLGMSGDPEGLPIARVLAAADGRAEFFWSP